MSDSIRVSIVGKNEIVREGLKRILLDQAFVVETAVADANGLVATAAQGSDPDLIIVDAYSDNENYDICRHLQDRFAGSRIVLMADDYSVERVAQAFAAGVSGYLVKAISCEPLGGALRLVALGEKVMPSQIVESLAGPVWQGAPRNWQKGKLDLNLSDREVQILRCLISGDANKLIARRLDITEATVKVHIKAILRKLRVMNRTQAAIWAVMRGLDQEEAAAAAKIHEFPARRETALLQVVGA